MINNLEQTVPHKKSSINNLKPTKVLLACIKNEAGSILTHNLLYKLFNQYGEPVKILIFEKKSTWKAFVEMDSIENAKIAIEKLNNSVIFQDGSKINVYFSDREEINFQNNNSGGCDFSLKKQRSPEFKELENKKTPSLHPDSQQKFFSFPTEITKQELESTKISLCENDLQSTHISSTLLTMKMDEQNIKKMGLSQPSTGPPRRKNIKLMISSAPFESESNINSKGTSLSPAKETKNENNTPISIAYNMSRPAISPMLVPMARNHNNNNYKLNLMDFNKIESPMLMTDGNYNMGLMNNHINNLSCGAIRNPPPNLTKMDQYHQFENKRKMFDFAFDEINPKANDFDNHTQNYSKVQSPIMRAAASPKKSIIEHFNESSDNEIEKNLKKKEFDFEEENEIFDLLSNQNKIKEKENEDQHAHNNPKEDNDDYDQLFKCNFNKLKDLNESKESSDKMNSSAENKEIDIKLPFIINSNFNSDVEIKFHDEENDDIKLNLKKSISKKQNILEKIDKDIQKNADTGFNTTIKNIDNMIKVESDASEFGNFQNSFSDIHSNCITPIKFLTPKPVFNFGFFNNAQTPNSIVSFGDDTNQQNVNTYIVPENKKSKVIYVRGLENDLISIQMIYSLFSNFGNILKIMFLKKKSVALIDFENLAGASQAKEYLNNLVYFGQALKIFYSNYSEINLKHQDSQPEEVLIGNEKNFRFKKVKSISINPPSNVLHVSNLKKDVCNYETINNIFGTYGKIEGIKFLVMDYYKNMCLVKFATVEQSVIAMCYLHGKEVMGRKIQISFTRTKI